MSAALAPDDLAPDDFGQANALAASNQLPAAAEAYRRVLAAQPGHAAALMNLGNVLAALGDLDAAIAYQRRAASLAPDHAMAHGNLAITLHRAGMLDQAEAAFSRALALREDDPVLHYNAGLLRQQRDQRLDAAASFNAALALAPGFAAARAALGMVLAALGLVHEAADQLRAAIKLQPSQAAFHINLGNVLRDANDLDGAIAAHEHAIELQPDLAAAHANLGNEYHELGRVQDAAQAYRRACRLEPRNASHLLSLANTGTLRADDRLVDHLRQLIAAAGADAAGAELQFALARVLHDSGDTEAAFAAMLTANALHRATFEYNEADTVAGLAAVQGAYPEGCFNLPPPAPGQPVLVVGMPRSGTTLVEHILASHPAIHGAGECPDLPRLTSALRHPRPPDTTLSTLGAAYAAALRVRAPQAARIVDKLPDNLRRLGLVHAALPQARIIHVARDPFATCLSCFAKLFRGDLPYAYDLGELGRYFRAQECLMAHWRRVLPPGVLLEVKPQDLLADLPGQTRRMLAHLGLDWDEACLRYFETSRPVRTASLDQVRRPPGQGRTDWSAYRPLAGALTNALVTCPRSSPSFTAHAGDKQVTETKELVARFRP